MSAYRHAPVERPSRRWREQDLVYLAPIVGSVLFVTGTDLTPPFAHGAPSVTAVVVGLATVACLSIRVLGKWATRV